MSIFFGLVEISESDKSENDDSHMINLTKLMNNKGQEILNRFLVRKRSWRKSNILYSRKAATGGIL